MDGAQQRICSHLLPPPGVADIESVLPVLFSSANFWQTLQETLTVMLPFNSFPLHANATVHVGDIQRRERDALLRQSSRH